ncbi:MAG: tetratricopeptide repeat protein [Bacteroidetes bacterium]|nr:MAG: tetratricopeptide repeat protein [Bacteroidota bacterium]
MKYFPNYSIAVCCLLFAFSFPSGRSGWASAQTLPDAIKLSESEQFEKAGAAFISLIQREPTQGDNFFHYGENYFRQEIVDSSFKAMDLDSARMCYERGIKKNPGNPLNYVGMGKVYWYEGKTAEAKKQFFDAVQIISPANKTASFTGKQKAMVYMKIAECYTKARVKDLQEANTQLNKALKEDPNNPEIFIQVGDVTLEQNPGEASKAIQQYKKAYDMDKKSAKALLRIGQLYNRARNLSEAVSNYDAAILADPNFAPAYREKAEAFYRGKQYETAIKNYKTYLELNSGSLSARIRYASFLYLSKKYNESVAEILEIQKTNSSIPFLYRLLAYSYFETGSGNQSITIGMDKTNAEKIAGKPKNVNTTTTKDGTSEQWIYERAYLYFENGKLTAIQTIKSASLPSSGSSGLGRYADGLMAMETFLSKASEKKILASDYEYYGKLLSKTGNDSLAVDKLKQAIAKDTSKTELWGELGSSLLKAKKYPEAINAFNKKIAGKVGVDANDHYNLGRSYFYSKQFGKADTAFTQITVLQPEIPTGYLWRGKANAQLDPDSKKGLAKPYYEMYLAKIKPEEAEKNKKDMVPAYEYMGYYFMLRKDYGNAKCFYQKLAALDPANKKAKEALAEANVSRATCAQ